MTCKAAFAADYVIDHLRAENIAVVHDQSAYGKGIADEFRKATASARRPGDDVLRLLPRAIRSLVT